MKVRGDFLGPPRSTDKTTLIIKERKGAKSIKIKYKLKMKKNSIKGTKQLKIKEKVAKKVKKGKKETKTKIDKTQLKTMVGICNAAETGTMKLV